MVFSIIHPDLYEWVKSNLDHFDLSDSKMVDIQDNTNKEVVGKFKNDLNDLIMTDCVSLSPKVYSYNYQSANGEIINSKKLKGLSTPVVSNEISHNDQITTLDTNKPIKRKTTSFRSLDHQVYTLTQENCIDELVR